MSNMFYIVVGFIGGIWFTQVNPTLAGNILTYVSHISFIQAIFNQ